MSRHSKPWRKLWRQASPRFEALPVQARGLADELVRHADEDGSIRLGTSDRGALWRYLGAHPRERRALSRHLDLLVQNGTVEERADGWQLPSFERHQGGPERASTEPATTAPSTAAADHGRAMGVPCACHGRALGVRCTCVGRALGVHRNTPKPAKPLERPHARVREEEEGEGEEELTPPPTPPPRPVGEVPIRAVSEGEARERERTLRAVAAKAAYVRALGLAPDQLRATNQAFEAFVVVAACCGERDLGEWVGEWATDPAVTRRSPASLAAWSESRARGERWGESSEEQRERAKRAASAAKREAAEVERRRWEEHRRAELAEQAARLRKVGGE